jgi:hypothetical protein
MTGKQQPTAGPSRQEKNGFLRVTPTPGKPQPFDSATPTRTIKRPFGGGETTARPLVKRSRKDQNGDESRPRVRKPRTIDAAAIIENFQKANEGTLEEVRA